MTVGDVDQQRERQLPPSAAPIQPGGETLSAAPELTRAASGDLVADGPFTTRQLLRLDEALRVADQQTGLTFGVYIGDLGPSTRDFAESLHKQIDDAPHAVLIAVSPNQRKLEIVTGSQVRRRISDRDAKLAGLSMAAAFAGGDLAGGVLSGIDQLASHAGRH